MILPMSGRDPFSFIPQQELLSTACVESLSFFFKWFLEEYFHWHEYDIWWYTEYSTIYSAHYKWCNPPNGTTQGSFTIESQPVLLWTVVQPCPLLTLFGFTLLICLDDILGNIFLFLEISQKRGRHFSALGIHIFSEAQTVRLPILNRTWGPIHFCIFI